MGFSDLAIFARELFHGILMDVKANLDFISDIFISIM